MCGTSPTSAAARAGVEVGRIVAADVDPAARARAPVPWSAHSSDDLPEPLRPMSAAISPARSSTSTSRTATTAPNRTTMPAGAQRDVGRARADGSTAGGGSTPRGRR